MQRTLDGLASFFGVFGDKLGDAMDKGVFQPLGNWCFAPRKIDHTLLRAAAFKLLSCIHQPFSGVITPVEHNVFSQFFQTRVKRVVNAKLAGIDDAHIHALARWHG
jgi:hypothetical protein